MKDVFSRDEMVAESKSMTDSYGILKESNELVHKNVFLSYSSDDSDIVPFVYQVLTINGGRVYLDKFDPRLPKSDFTKVAKKLSEAAERCDKMVLLVSRNVKDSIWIPWEIGLGHGYHTRKNVALFLATDDENNTSWKDQEYLGMYQRIVEKKYVFFNGYYIYEPDTQRDVSNLRDWLTNNNRGKGQRVNLLRC